MAAIEAIMFAGAAGFAVIVIATILVVIGVHQEQALLNREGRKVFAHHEPPTIPALLARKVLGAHFNLLPHEIANLSPSDDEPPWYQRPVGPRVR
jgi:hypothetical protein